MAMPPPNYLTVPAEITKAQIAPLHAKEGQTNAVAITIGDSEHPPCSLSFEGFAGALQDGLYRGNLRFLPVHPDLATGMPAFSSIDGLLMGDGTWTREAIEAEPVGKWRTYKPGPAKFHPKPDPADSDTPEEN